MRIDELRAALHEQARETEGWELPALPHHPRRTPPRRTWAVLAAAAAVVAALLVVPSLLDGSVSTTPTEVAAGAPRPVDRQPVSLRCDRDAPECALPASLEVGGRLVDRVDLRTSTVDPGGEVTFGMAPVPAGGFWVLVGSPGDHPALRVSVDDGPVTEVPAGDGLTLLRVPAAVAETQDISVARTDDEDADEVVVAGVYRLAQDGVRSDWESNGAQCEALTAECAAPGSVLVDGIDLVRGEDAAVGRGDLTGRFDRPQPGIWFMLGSSQPDDGGPLEVRVGGGEPVAVPVDRPVLVRVPDGAPASYEVRTADGRPLPLFMRVYRLAES